MTIDEYMALRRLISSEKEAEGTDMSFQEKRRQRRTSGYTKELGRQIRKVREKATLKNGTLRKGWDESKIMTEAHKQTRRMRKKD
ncbi:MAG: hypothetical protein ACTSRU_20980 [Candidatus Hodarchaeales archaeon]